MTTTDLLPRYAVRLTPRELETRQKEVKEQARQWLDPEHLAALLLDRSHDDLGRAAAELFNAAYEHRQLLVKIEQLDADHLEDAADRDAGKVFAMLVEYFGDECILELAKEYDTDNGDDDGGGEPAATKQAA
jgi:hypothetical protein